MLKSANYRHILLWLLLGMQTLHAQNWQPAMAGLHPNQTWYDVNFKTNLLGKDWIYGTWLDEDSSRCCVAYREGGRWNPLPISFNDLSFAYDIARIGDTLLISGSFGQPTSLIDSSQSTSVTGFLKWHNDSLWFDNRLVGAEKICVSNDSILIWGTYIDTSYIIFGQILSVDGGRTWAYPYSTIHPTEATANFGPFAGLEIYNGDFYTLNNGSPGSDSAGWKGIVRWDGTQWHAYPYGMWGGFARTTTSSFYKDELYIGGSFFQSDHPNNPGNGIARWDGAQWTSMGGGVGNYVRELFVVHSLLYCNLAGTGFADAPISYFAAWNGDQWCGTPGNFARPPATFGFANDTLYCTFLERTTVDGDSVSFMNFFDGDYINGPNAVCSTYDLGTEDQRYIEQRLIISPNPFSTSAVIELGDDNYDVTIMDITGRIVRQMTDATGNVVIERGNMRAGVYMMTVVNEKGNARMTKFIVE